MIGAATKYVRHSLKRCGKGEGVHLDMRATGCFGLAYVLESVDELAAEDLAFESHDVKTIIGPRNLAYLDGTKLDFIRERLNGDFKFNNPNIRGEYDCDESLDV